MSCAKLYRQRREGFERGPGASTRVSLLPVLALVLVFFFGYSTTMLPLLRSGLAVMVTLASDTLSIAVVEGVDSLIMITTLGTMEAGKLVSRGRDTRWFTGFE